ncbi:MAG: O-antigen ligase family protein [Bacilli bacterium]
MDIKIKSVKDKAIKGINNSELLIVILFALVLSLKCNNIIIDIIAVTIMALICMFTKMERLICIMIFMFFFEGVAKVDILGGSIARLTITISFIRILVEVIKNRIKFNKKNKMTILLFSLLLIISIITKNNVIAAVITYLNIVTLILFNSYFSSSLSNVNSEALYENIKKFLALSVFLAIVYGLVTNNFLNEHRSGYENLRFNGVKDPNYMALYINIGLIFAISCKSFFYKRSKLILIISLIVGIVLTKSTTGILLSSLTMLLYFLLLKKSILLGFIKRNRKRVLIISTILLTICMAFSIVFINNYSKKTHINEYGVEVGNNRVSDIIVAFKQKDFDRLTSIRTLIWREHLTYFNNKNLINKTFGEGVMVNRVYSSYWEKEMLSHNTFIDLLNSMGVCGFILFIIFMVNKFKNNKILNYKLPKGNFEYRLLLSILLLYGMMLSLYPERIIMFIFLL